jgi:AbrB family looped-hinge helix DNA binding protein
MLSTVTTKGQVTIPKRIRDHLDIKPNDRVDFFVEGDRAVLVPVRPLSELRGVVSPMPGSDIRSERRKAKRAVAKRVKEEQS